MKQKGFFFNWDQLKWIVMDDNMRRKEDLIEGGGNR